MKVSIITVCFNSALFISTAIESVLAQSYTDIEYIVIDGDSKDGTLDVINKYADRIAHIVSEPDKGIYDAMNKGLALATGDVIGILNSDDFYPHSDVVSEVVKELSLRSNIDIVLGSVDFVMPKDLEKPIRLYSSADFISWKLRFGLSPPHPGAFIKKSAYERAGMYKMGYKIAADFDMFVRMLLVMHFSYITLDKVLVRMRIGGASTSGINSYIVSTKEMARSLKENKVYSSILIVLMRLPVKSLQIILIKLGVK
ncbi:hypothetical protein LCGC14_0901480 [marine sediment metagenome]|uniref:Glycosyltransferase 2-like domain-containing protein n=1 Tax=marine sediment metagenome TaxID=412755 RepID=A0A0F9S390_9ZZZZ|nr:glycosyltransferase [Methylophaga sp.]HEC58428.1 glycosyltransferase [Methylophaga sp.]